MVASCASTWQVLQKQDYFFKTQPPENICEQCDNLFKFWFDHEILLFSSQHKHEKGKEKKILSLFLAFFFLSIYGFFVVVFLFVFFAVIQWNWQGSNYFKRQNILIIDLKYNKIFCLGVNNWLPARENFVVDFDKNSEKKIIQTELLEYGANMSKRCSSFILFREVIKTSRGESTKTSHYREVRVLPVYETTVSNKNCFLFFCKHRQNKQYLLFKILAIV